MDIRQYKPAILRALKAANLNDPPEKVAELILGYCDFARELMGDMGASASRRKEDFDIPLVGEVKAAEPPKPSSQWKIGEPPPPARLRPKVQTQDTQTRELSEILDFVEQNAPPVMNLDLGDGKPPIQMRRRVKTKNFSIGGVDAGGSVQLFYLLPGEPENSEASSMVGGQLGPITNPPPTFDFMTTDVDLDLGRALDELLEANKARVSREKREIRPVPAKVIPMTLESAMASSMSADAGDGPRSTQNLNTADIVEYFRRG